jgi:membrane protein HdeD
MSTSSSQLARGARSPAAEGTSHRSSALLLGVGAVEIVMGVIAIVWPAAAAVSIAILLGTLLLIEGGVALVSAFAARGWQLLGRLIWSIVGGLAGIYLLAYPDEGVVGLTALLVIVMFFAGFAFLVTGLMGDENRGLLLVVGALGINVGALIWAGLPTSADWAIGLLVGFHFLARGIETTTLGLDLRRKAKRGAIGEAVVGRA